MDPRSTNPAGQQPTPGQGAVTNVMDYAMALTALAGIALEPKAVDGHHYVMVPQGYKREDITEAVEKARPAPIRKRGTIQVHDLASLIAYVKHQGAEDNGYLYADIESRKIIAVLNDHKAAMAPGWRDHRCVYAAAYTKEFEKWLTLDRKQFSQMEFAEHIEDNFADLEGEHAQTLLDVATTINAKTGITFASARRLDNGQVQMVYNEVIDATAGAQGSLEIPKVFTLGMRVFRNGDGYKIRARLKYRLNSGKVQFWYELDRIERTIEDAFKGYIEQLRADSGYSVLLGAP